MLFVRKLARQIQGLKLVHLYGYISVFCFSEVAFYESVLDLLSHNLGNYGLWYIFWGFCVSVVFFVCVFGLFCCCGIVPGFFVCLFCFWFFFKTQSPSEPVPTICWVWRDSSVAGFPHNCQGFKLRKHFPGKCLTGRTAFWHLSLLLLNSL